MRCVIAAEGDAAPKIIEALRSMEEFGKWQFVPCADYQELLQQQGNRPDVIAISRFLPGEKHPTLLRNLPFMFPGSRIVLLLGEMDEEARAYEKLARKFGLENIVRGPLPGESPYNLPTALQRDISEICADYRQLSLVEPTEQHDKDQCQEDLIQDEEATVYEEDQRIHEKLTRQESKQVAEVLPTLKRRKISLRRRVKREAKPEIVTQPLLEPLPQKVSENPWSRQPEEIVSLKEQIKGRKGIAVSVAANKGGVGKTSVLVKLANELTKVGLSVCIMDLDLHDPSIAIHYGLSGIPGIEVLANRPVSGQLIDDLIQEITPNLKVLPGVMDKRIDPYLERGKVNQILDYLTGCYDVVMVDTPAEFWRRENVHLKDAFTYSSIILAVIEQVSYSVKGSSIYGPKILAFGGKRENIRLVITKYVANASKLPKANELEKAFNASFKVKDIKTSWIIPNNYVAFAESSYTGNTVEIDDSYSQCQQLVKEICEKVGKTYAPPIKPEVNKKTSLFGGIKALCGLIKRK